MLWASLVLDGAQRLGADAPTLRQIIARPADAVEAVRAHYFPNGEGADAARELLEAAVHTGLSHTAWLKRHDLDAATPKLEAIKVLQKEVRTLSQAILASAGGVVERERASLPAYFSPEELQRTLWIRWLQSREDALRSRVEQKLHARRREQGTRLLVDGFRLLCPLAYVPGGLLVEDTLLRDG